MFPLRDENPTVLVPAVTIAIIVVNVLAWLFVQHAGVGEAFVESLCSYGAIPAEITGALVPGTWVPLGPDVQCLAGGLSLGTLLTSMFLHGSWMHLIGNMWFLWVFGNNIEDCMGHARFAVFYLLTGLLASAAHIATSMSSAVPTVGASGAISGVMGAYILLYPTVRVHTLIVLLFFMRVVALPAVFLLGLWFALQLFEGTMTPGGGSGVAFWAHVGGFVAGVALIKLFERPRLVGTPRTGRLPSERERPPWNRR